MELLSVQYGLGRVSFGLSKVTSNLVLVKYCLVNTQYFNGVPGGPRRFLIGLPFNRTAAQCLNMPQDIA